MKSILIWFINLTIYSVLGVQIPPPNIGTLTYSFTDAQDGQLTTKAYSSCVGYSSTKDEIFILGGDLYEGNTQVPPADTKTRGQAYNPVTKQTRALTLNIPSNRPNLYCGSQNYIQFGERLVIVYPNEIIEFDMVTEQFTVTQNNFLDGDDTTANGNEDELYIAVASDFDEYLFIVSRDKLYVLDLYDFNAAPIYSGSPLVQKGRYGHCAAYANGNLYVLSGYGVNGNTNNFEVGIEKVTIDLDNTQNMGFTKITAKVSQYYYGGRVLVVSDYIYIIGGATQFTTGWVGSKTLKLLNPTNDAVSNKGSIKTGRLFSGVIVRYGKIFVIGGLTITGNNIGSNTIANIERSQQSTSAECVNEFRPGIARRLGYDLMDNEFRRLQGGNAAGPGGGASPDPHFRSIYGTPFDFHGDGCYIYVDTCPDVPFRLPFSIRAKHYKCNSVARCMQAIYIELFDTNGDSVKLIDTENEPAFNGVIEGVGDLLITPFKGRTRILRLQTPFAKANNCGYDFNILIRKTRIGLSIKSNFPECYKCEACGIFGYYGESKNYQFIKGDPLGTLKKPSESIVQYGYTWKYGNSCLEPPQRPPFNKPDKGENDDLVPSVCETNAALKQQITQECNKIQQENAACCEGFDECANVLEDCINDGCAILTDEPNKPIADAVREVGEDNIDVACITKEGIPDPEDLATNAPTKAPTKNTPAPVPKIVTTSPTKNTPAPVPKVVTTSPTKNTPAPVPKVVTTSPTKNTPAPIPAINIYTCENPLRPNIRRLQGANAMGPASSVGDPHLKTFFQTRYDYQGKGCYYLSTLCPGKPAGLLPYAIRAQHRKCNSVARCIENIYIDIIDNTGKIIDTIDTKVDLIKDVDQVKNYPNIGDLTIGKWSASFRSFQLDTPFSNENNCGPAFKISIRTYKYNGVNFINYYADPPRCYTCEVCGLTGFVNPEKTKQFLASYGQVNTNIKQFAESYAYGEECVCPEEDNYVPPVEPPVEPICDKDPNLLIEVQTKCENRPDADEELKKCCEQFPEDCKGNIDNCVTDVCAHLTDNINTSVDEAVDIFTNANLRGFCETQDIPTKSPIKSPTRSPIIPPTKSPVPAPTKSPIPAPTKSPVPAPTRSPIVIPDGFTSKSPSKLPSKAPTTSPVKAQTKTPTRPPTTPTAAPTKGNVVVPDCKSIFGIEADATSTQTVAMSTAECEEGYTLVSCGTFGSIYSPGGTLITNGHTCTALNIFGQTIDRVQAVARCCKFPPDSNINIIKRNGDSKQISETKCVEPEILIGCGVSSTDNNVIGSFLGADSQAPKESSELTSTNNQCNGKGYGDTCVTSNVQCAVYDTALYNLKCESQTLLTKTPLKCPNGWFMTSCSGLTEDQALSIDNTTPLDHYYISPSNECKTQQDNVRPLYTSMVCCQLTTTNENAAAYLFKPNKQQLKRDPLKNSTIFAILICVITVLLTMICTLLCYKTGGHFVFKKGYARITNPSDSAYSSSDTTDLE